MFKPLPANMKNPKLKKVKKKARYIKLEDVNKFLKNRRLDKLRIKDGVVTIAMTDGRRIIVSLVEDSPKIKIKRDGSCMSARELQRMNDQIEIALKNLKKGVPRECKPCVATLTAEDIL